MPEKRNKHDGEFRAGAVRVVSETGKPIAVIARDLGVNLGPLGNWVACRCGSTVASSCVGEPDTSERGTLLRGW